jgi:protein-S-isoprenylcysteine O-methyltransferase Ste14
MRIYHLEKALWISISLSVIAHTLLTYETQQPAFAMLRLVSSVLMLLAMVYSKRPKPPPRWSFKNVSIPMLHAFLPFLFLETQDGLSAMTTFAAGILFLTGFLVTSLAFLDLWTSFGVLPGNRGVRSAGVYRFVRHPIYLGYNFSAIAFVIASHSLRNFVVFSAFVFLTLWRIKIEEQILVLDPEYQIYSFKTPHRLMPGVY